MTALDALVAGLEEVATDVFRPVQEDHTLFGGMLLARALQAAGATVVDRPPHAIEGRFLQGGAWGDPVLVHVERLRDGGLLSSRRAEIRQGDAVLFTLDASFGHPPESPEYQVPSPPMPPVDAPVSDEWRGFDDSLGFETREHVGNLEGEEDPAMARARRIWVRTMTALPEDPLLQACTLAMLSDTRTGMTAMGSVDRPSGQRASSLNHAMWFHRPAPPDWFAASWSPLVTRNRLALIHGSIHTADGVRCASYIQELLLREQQTDMPPDVAARLRG